jgi:hypothetical protein
MSFIRDVFLKLRSGALGSLLALLKIQQLVISATEHYTALVSSLALM